MAEEEVVDVTCLGCGLRIHRPSDANMEWFRIGIPVHNMANDGGLNCEEVGGAKVLKQLGFTIVNHETGEEVELEDIVPVQKHQH